MLSCIIHKRRYIQSFEILHRKIWLNVNSHDVRAINSHIQQNTTKRTTEIPIVCRYSGTQRVRGGCKFIHEAGPADIGISTEQSAASQPSPEPSPIRKISIKPKIIFKDIKANKTRDYLPAHQNESAHAPANPKPTQTKRRNQDQPKT